MKIDRSTMSGMCENCEQIIPEDRLQGPSIARLCVLCRRHGLHRG
jgi:RNA polymerase-binding transcription factor DksA